ncbi:type A chloramphenicol O-acetyltransferase [Paenibacillus sp. N3/727]|uniref:type A chloramphenicol O-acetyltransferase n=1 Tax=Paenibacillus sp. N3/727 TaxID=2925845 RepID=UPI001F52CDBE|nr:type A chloramphenicol O-acetyltransferase [Paenibacillus sp. N3/727]UNK17889.1 type A chloramphenicol O-acetyltransferase [Paenibacillus sp. N3/727]
MNFNLIDMESWNRKPYFEHYLNQVRCTFSITANIDITSLLVTLRAQDIKLYPTFIYMITKVVNAHVEFRTCFNEENELGYWDRMIPDFTIFHNDDKSFSSIWTEFFDDFQIFYNNYEKDLKQYGDVKGIVAKNNVPMNSFPISSIPWVNFTGFNINVFNDGKYLLPIVTGGKYFCQDGRTLLPVSLQVHHAVCDGYHASQFINELQQLANNYDEWLQLS